MFHDGMNKRIHSKWKKKSGENGKGILQKLGILKK